MGSTDIYADTIRVRVYAGGGSMEGEAVKAYLTRNTSYGNADFTVNVMGYFRVRVGPPQPIELARFAHAQQAFSFLSTFILAAK